MKQTNGTTTITCPHCGKTITIMVLGQKAGLLNTQSGSGSAPGPAMLRPLWNRGRMHPYQYGTASLYDQSAPATPTAAVRVPIREFSQEPARAAGWEPDVVVPISNALIAGLLATTILGTCCFFIEGLPLWTPPVGGLGTTTIVWWMLQKYGLDMQRRVQEVEYDEQPQQPQERLINTHDTLYVIPAPAGSQVQQHDDGSYWARNPEKTNGWTRIGEAAIPYKSALPRVARAILPPPEGMSCPFTKRRLAQATGLSEEQVLTLQRALMNAGLLQWRDDNPNHPAGPELTDTGKELFNRVLDQAPYAGAPE